MTPNTTKGVAVKLAVLRDFFAPQIDEVDAALARYLEQTDDPPHTCQTIGDRLAVDASAA